MLFKIGTLHRRDIARAYSLMERIMPGLSAERWFSLTASADLRRAWLVARDTEGYIFGICHMRQRGQGDFRRQLEIPLIGVIALSGIRDVEAALFAAARERAVRQQCTVMHVWAAVPSSWDVLETYLDQGPWDHGRIYRVDEDFPDQPIFPVKM